MVSDLKILAGSAAAIAALLCPEYASIQSASRQLLMQETVPENRDTSIRGRRGTKIIGYEKKKLDFLGLTADNARLLRESARKAERKKNEEDLVRDQYETHETHESYQDIDEDLIKFNEEPTGKAFVLKTIGAGTLIASGVLFTFAPWSLSMVIVIAGLFTIGVALSMLNRQGHLKSLNFFLPLLAAGGFATHAVCQYVADEGLANEALYTTLSNWFEFGAIIMAAIALYVIGSKAINGGDIFKCGGDKRIMFQRLGLGVASLGFLALAPTCTFIPKHFGLNVADFTQMMTFGATCAIFVGLLTLAISFVFIPRNGDDLGNYANASKLTIVTTVGVLAAAAGVVVGAGINAFGDNAQLATALMTYCGAGAGCLIVLIGVFAMFRKNMFHCKKAGGGQEQDL